MHGHQHGNGMQHSEDVLRRARETRDDPRASRRDHEERLGHARLFVGAVGVAVIAWVLWTNLLA